MAKEPTSFLSPKLEARPHPEKGGYGVFANERVETGELVALWSGAISDAQAFAKLPSVAQRHSVQVEEGFYQIPIGPSEPADFINHCCDANVGMSGQIALVAMRVIEPGEEACMDYAMCDGTPYDEFDCRCGAPICRGRVTGDDWKRPDLWERYEGYFSPYLQRRIDQLKQAQA